MDPNPTGILGGGYGIFIRRVVAEHDRSASRKGRGSQHARQRRTLVRLRGLELHHHFANLNDEPSAAQGGGPGSRVAVIRPFRRRAIVERRDWPFQFQPDAVVRHRPKHVDHRIGQACWDGGAAASGPMISSP